MPSTKKQPGRPRHVMRCLGQLRPEAIYTKEGCLRYAGIGNDVLIQARQSGVVKPIEIGRRLYYLGSELVEWIRSQNRKGTDE